MPPADATRPVDVVPPADETRSVDLMPSGADVGMAEPPSRLSGATTQVIHGWGGGRGVPAQLIRLDGADGARAAVRACRGSAARAEPIAGAIARGMGRSYGDAAQLHGGLVLDMTRVKGFAVDPGPGTVTAHAGVTIGELLRELVPAGWMLPVVPGTQHVTVGGAVASDVHGKNHATAGTFGSHVRALGLLTAAGEELHLTPGSPDGLFEATVAGMGLTGVILWAQIGLRSVTSSQLSVDTDRAACLDDALALLGGPGGSHRIAWLDLLGRPPGRGVVTRAEHDSSGRGLASATVRARATVPARWPSATLRAGTVGAFNELRFRRSPRHERGRPEKFGAHMFPLDALGAWPRLYGEPGLLQYQFLVPRGHERVLEAAIERVRRARVPCFLATLKDLGAANDSPLSFPLPGWTLALDLPRAAPGVEALLDALDGLVAEAGGRVYLTKDARMGPAATSEMYPRLGDWRAVRARVDPDGWWRSDLALRTGLISANRR